MREFLTDPKLIEKELARFKRKAPNIKDAGHVLRVLMHFPPNYQGNRKYRLQVFNEVKPLLGYKGEYPKGNPRY